MEQAPTPTTTATMPSQPVEKKRYEWIDNARIIAAFLIMYVHLFLQLPDDNFFNNHTIFSLINDTTFSGRVPFFLILAGYFLGRNITWSKAWDRCIWLLIPLAIWNILWGCKCSLDGGTLAYERILGIGAIFTPSWSISSIGPCTPYDIPSWFLRDIMFLSLLTPIISKLKSILPALLIIYAIFYGGSHMDTHMRPEIMLVPDTCFFYFLGVCLSSLKIQDAYKIFNTRFTPVLIVLLIASIYFSINANHAAEAKFPISIFGQLIGAMMIAHFGVLIEQHLPKLSSKMAPLGPSCFLVFMLHYPFYCLMDRIFPDCIRQSYWMLLIPIPTFILISGFFLAMKRYTPWLMPYLGHMKLPKKTAKN